MAIQIIGRKIEARPNEVFVEGPDGVYAFSKQIVPFQTKAEIAPEDYALVQEGDVVNYAMSINQGFNGSKWEQTSIEVLKSRLSIPRSSIFITQYKNVNLALQGKRVLYDVSGNLIEDNRLDTYAHRLNHNCWVHLNDFFKKGQGFLGLDLVAIIGLDEEGNPIMQREHLEDCLQEDSWADLESTNSQGFPTKKAKIERYEPGKTVYFIYPRIDSVAWFLAFSDWVVLYCDWDSQGSDSALGVFPCTEGAKKI
ncbi:hypothetical protein HYV88_03490 [Candidatus Woesearchaeota archaeon]|nr:hypothetical protein [Candidatus Woesearchaeota archaeon]